MSKKQKRRSVSVKANTYNRLKWVAAMTKSSCSGLLEKIVNELADKHGCPSEVGGPPAREIRTEGIGGNFTF
jgi:hypothetical protein